jgi:hypothetical protein
MPNFFYNLSNINGFCDLVNSDNNVSDALKMNSVECKSSNNQKYKIIRYDKNMMSSDLYSTYGLCRSVIINSSNNVVSFSPPKSIPSFDFITKYGEHRNENVVAEEFVEGTMINVFWDPNIGLTGGWEIATRNNVGATTTFFKKLNAKTFRDMFLEAAQENNLIIENLNRTFCYSFVLQHPENRIVVPFTKPQLYLVAVYQILNSAPDNITVFPVSMQVVKELGWATTNIRFPQVYKYDFVKELIENYASMNSPYDVLGFVLYNTETGERTKFRNPVYEQVRSLRGNQPKLQYQYLCLRQEGKVSDYLKFYPEHSSQFSIFRDQIHEFTGTLYKNYISCYIKKEKPLLEFSEQFRTHMFRLHQLYLNDLKEKNEYVSSRVVIKYVNELHPSLFMYCLNFSMRKRNVDFIKSDVSAELA